MDKKSSYCCYSCATLSLFALVHLMSTINEIHLNGSKYYFKPHRHNCNNNNNKNNEHKLGNFKLLPRITNHTELGNLEQYGQLDTLPLLIISNFAFFYFNEIQNKHVMYCARLSSREKENARNGSSFFCFSLSFLTLVFVFAALLLIFRNNLKSIQGYKKATFKRYFSWNQILNEGKISKHVVVGKLTQLNP